MCLPAHQCSSVKPHAMALSQMKHHHWRPPLASIEFHRVVNPGRRMLISVGVFLYHAGEFSLYWGVTCSNYWIYGQGMVLLLLAWNVKQQANWESYVPHHLKLVMSFNMWATGIIKRILIWVLRDVKLLWKFKYLTKNTCISSDYHWNTCHPDPHQQTHQT